MAAEGDWVAALEEKVLAAVRRIKSLRSENEALTRKVRELEGRLAATPETEQVSRWADERAEIRGRVERLTERLEELLEVAAVLDAPDS